MLHAEKKRLSVSVGAGATTSAEHWTLIQDRPDLEGCQAGETSGTKLWVSTFMIRLQCVAFDARI